MGINEMLKRTRALTQCIEALEDLDEDDAERVICALSALFLPDPDDDGGFECTPTPRLRTVPNE